MKINDAVGTSPERGDALVMPGKGAVVKKEVIPEVSRSVKVQSEVEVSPRVTGGEKVFEISPMSGIKKVIKTDVRKDLFTPKRNEVLSKIPLKNVKLMELSYSLNELCEIVKDNLLKQKPELTDLIDNVEVITDIKGTKYRSAIALVLNKEAMTPQKVFGNFLDKLNSLSNNKINITEVSRFREMLEGIHTQIIIDNDKIYAEIDFNKILTELILAPSITGFNVKEVIYGNFSYTDVIIDKDRVTFGIIKVTNINERVDELFKIIDTNGLYLEILPKYINTVEYNFTTTDVREYILNNYRSYGITAVEFIDPIQNKILSSLDKSSDIKYYRMNLLSSSAVDGSEVKVDKVPVIFWPQKNFIIDQLHTGTFLDKLRKNSVNSDIVFKTFPRLFTKGFKLLVLGTSAGIGLVPSLSNILKDMSGLSADRAINFEGINDSYQVVLSII